MMAKATGAVLPIRTLLIDDEPLAIERLQILCAALPQAAIIGSAQDADNALQMIDTLAPELLLLDIAMPVMSGIDLARLLAARPVRPLIIFVTAFDAFAVAAFDVAAVDYLLKPIEPERLLRAIDRAITQRALTGEAQTPWACEFWLPYRGEIMRITADDIDWIEAERDYMRLHTVARSYLLHTTITQLEARLDPDRFLRLHRSTIVRRDAIAGLRRSPTGNWLALLTDGTPLSIGRSYLDAVRALIPTNSRTP
jgi:two-component system response regulator AlgR